MNRVGSAIRSEKRKDAWESIAREARRVVEVPASHLTQDPARFSRNHQRVQGLLVDWSRQHIDERAISSLDRLATHSNVPEFLDRLARGDALNVSEDRGVMHMALRHPSANCESKVADQIRSELQSMLEFATDVRRGRHTGYDGRGFTDVLHIGIGGSHLGPAFVCDALASDCSLQIHFCTNADRREVRRTLAELSPSRTLVIVASKSYTTHETRVNASFVRSWFAERVSSTADISRHFVHITSNDNAVVGNERVLRVPDTVGGRFSLWSAMGLPIALAIGREGFEELLQGAHAMDRHVLHTPVGSNVGVRLAQLALWNVNFLGATSHLVLPYDSRLRLLPAFCQQLEMESNGKSVDIDGNPVSTHTSPVIWGGQETDGQHAWHQFLHQGTQRFSADILAILDTPPFPGDQAIHRWILANAIAQSSVMLSGRRDTDSGPHRNIAGNRGSTVIILDRLDARTLGALIALYEHKVACAGCMLGINSFDQWGVEEGKLMANALDQALNGKNLDSADHATAELLRTIRARTKNT